MVDENALLQALLGGQIAGAGLDVLASEPPTAEPEEPRPSERAVCGAPPLRTRLVLRCDEGVSGRSRSSRVFSATLILSMC